VESVNVPVALNCWVVPSGIDGIAGVTAIETNCADETVRGVDPVTEPDVARIVVPPMATPVASPADVIVAIAEYDELQLTDAVMFCVLPSVKVPVAANC